MEEKIKSQKIQIVAFTTNEIDLLPNRILRIYIENNPHYIIKSNKHILAFSTMLHHERKSTKIMICTLINLSLEYESINEVDCYIIMIDLLKENSTEKLLSILRYMQQFCDAKKKIYIMGIKNESNGNKIIIDENDFINKIKRFNFNIEYNELDENKKVNISAYLSDIFDYCLSNKDPLIEKKEEQKENHNCGIC